MSFEGAALERADLEKMHRKASETIEKSIVNEKDFIEPNGPYGPETIERDIKEVESREKSFEQNNSNFEAEMKKVADIFEAIILEHGELSNWFGEYATTIKTSRYDDYVNGVDMVVEFRNAEENQSTPLGLAADVTFSQDSGDKFKRLQSQIENGSLAKVKYYHSEDMNIHGQLSKLPEVVIGASKNTVMEIAEMWADKELRGLETHKIQIMILEQIREQLEAFALYAEKCNPGVKDIPTLYRNRLAIIEDLLEEKKELRQNLKYELENDSVHAGIMIYLKRWRDKFQNENIAA